MIFASCLIQKNFKKTTDSSGVIHFPNLLEGRELTGVNQALVSDITYYDINNRWYYLTFIMDLYGRRIKGYTASRTLRTTDTTIPALQMAVKEMTKAETTGMIIHSDGGGQYYSRDFLRITHEHSMCNSMCKSVYENAHAERINGTIKNSYLKHYGPANYKELTRLLKKAVTMYNHQKPHQALKGHSPVQFEQMIKHNPQKAQLLTKKKVAKKKFPNNINQFLETCQPYSGKVIGQIDLA